MKQFVGNEMIRLQCVGVTEFNTECEFLLKRGMLIDFLLETPTRIRAEHKNMVIKKKDLDKLFVGEDGIFFNIVDLDEEKYLIGFINDIVKKNQYGFNSLGVFKILPNIYDDTRFRWKVNKKYNVKESVYISGAFEFHCTCDVNNDVMIDVKYAKCENLHRNRVTLATIKVICASNETILEAISNWQYDFINEVKEVTA